MATVLVARDTSQALYLSRTDAAYALGPSLPTIDRLVAERRGRVDARRSKSLDPEIVARKARGQLNPDTAQTPAPQPGRSLLRRERR